MAENTHAENTVDRLALAGGPGALRGAEPLEVLRAAAQAYPDKIAFASSLGPEDQFVTHLIAEANLAIPIFTLDTGRLFDETHDLIARTETRYGLRIRVLCPDRSELERMVEQHGVNLFRDSIAARKRCCEVRKLESLRRALADVDAWVCGLRREQSITREEVAEVEWDEANGLVKFNPLASWSEARLWSAIREHGIPYNRLHDAGMPSIGCAPCTRAVPEGDDPRSGRWWWEGAEHRECGLHARAAATATTEASRH